MKDKASDRVLFLNSRFSHKMKNDDLKARTREYAVRIIRLFAALPKSAEAQVIGKQMLRSGTSVGAHYRKSQFAGSDPDLISKIEVGLQELEETAYWLEILEDISIFPTERTRPLKDETSQLTAIFVTIVKKVKARQNS